MIHATHMFTKKEKALVLPQLGVTFFAESSSWIVNGTPKLITFRLMLRVRSQLASDRVLAQPSLLFSVD